MNWYSEVSNILFANLDKDAANHVWQKQLEGSNKKSSDREEDDE